MITFANKSKKLPQFHPAGHFIPFRDRPGNESIQAKLSVNARGDRYEQEADAIAGKIMRMKDEDHEPERTQASGITPLIHARSDINDTVNPAISDKINASRGKGTTLDSTTQSLMSSGFGGDFSNVRIHSDEESAWLNREINAKAFTVGSDIYFNDGEYRPGSEGGKHLLAHELVHTIQQGRNNFKVQRDGEDPAKKDKPEIDYKVLPPMFQLSLHHLIFKADTGQVQLDYKTQSMKAGLSYTYGGELALGLNRGGTSASFGWTPGDNDLKFKLSQGSVGLGLSASPEKQKFGASLQFGDSPLPPMTDMNKTFTAGATAGTSLVSGLGAGMQDPLAYYKTHKADIESVKNSVDLVQKITDSGKKKIRFGGDFALTYDPVSKLVFTVRIGGTF